MSEPKLTVGLMVRRVMRHGYETLEAQAMTRENDADYPRGMCGNWYPNNHERLPCIDGLRLDGSVSQFNDDPARFYLSAPAYREVYSIELSQAKGMAALLTKIAAQRERDQAYEHGDVFLAFARAIGAKWVCFEARRRFGDVGSGSMWRDTRWIWYGLTDGRNEYRNRIAEWINEVNDATRARLAPPEPEPAPSADDRDAASVDSVIALDADKLAAESPELAASALGPDPLGDWHGRNE